MTGVFVHDKTYREIAIQNNISMSTINKWRDKLGLFKGHNVTFLQLEKNKQILHIWSEKVI